MLVKLRGNGPEQVNLRRAISAAYYALFHAVCEVFAESVVGDGKELKRAWLQTYRSLNHKTVCNRLIEIHNFLNSDKKEQQPKQLNFPLSLKEVASTFSSLKDGREEADYNPQSERLQRPDVAGQIVLAKKAINELQKLDDKHKTALSAFIGISHNR